MDPQQHPSQDPYAQPQVPQDTGAGYTPPPQLDDYTQLTQQPGDVYARPELTDPAQSPQAPAAPQQHYTEEQAVAWARAKVEAAHHPDLHAITPDPQQSQQLPIPTSPESIPRPTPMPNEPASSTYSPPEEFATFDLPGTQKSPETPKAPDDIENKAQETQASLANNSQSPQEVVAEEDERKPPESTATSPKNFIQKVVSSFYQNGKFQIPHRLKPIIGAALTGLAVFAIFNSQVILGQIQYIINPGSGDSSNVSAALDEQVGPEPLVIIPKINVSAPVVYDVKTFDEQAVQKGLERGVVHYGNTALPGQLGNNVIVGHSSNNWWASGEYKFAFVLLDKLEVGDTFILNYNSKRYIYEVTNKKVVDPKDTSVLSQSTTVPITTLITCTPAGTSLNRLIIVGKQISPNPATDTQPVEPSQPASSDESILPGNTPSIIDKVREWFR